MTIATLQEFNADTEMCSTFWRMYSNLAVVFSTSTSISTCRDAKAVSFYNELEIHTATEQCFTSTEEGAVKFATM